jgi:hypothetical protein
MAMTMTMARVRRATRAVRKGPGKGSEQSMGRGKRRGMEGETVKGKVLLNKLQCEMISLVLWLCSCIWNGMRQTWTRSANLSGNNSSRKHSPLRKLPPMMIPILQSWMANKIWNLILLCISTWRIMCTHPTVLN